MKFCCDIQFLDNENMLSCYIFYYISTFSVYNTDLHNIFIIKLELPNQIHICKMGGRKEPKLHLNSSVHGASLAELFKTDFILQEDMMFEID